MKNYRKIVPLVLIVFMALSWYMLISSSAKTTNEYNRYLAEARKNAEIGVTKYAIENYNNALKIKSTVDVYAEVADYYKNQEKENELLSWCKDFFKAYPTEPKAYDCLLESYMRDKDYTSCYDMIYTAQKRNVSSDYITSVSNEIAYSYKIDFNSYDDVGVYSNNFCAIKSKDAWGFVDRYGTQRISCKYISVGIYTKSNTVPVVNSNGEPYFIDKNGEKTLVSKDKYLKFGSMIDNIALAQKESEKYVYVNQEFTVLHGEYDDAKALNNGVAAIKSGDAWTIINKDGKELNSSKYKNVVSDEKNIAYRNDRLFVETADGYIMIDSSGKQIGNQTFQDAKTFADNTYSAVKLEDKWCFIDKDGKLKSDKKYENARSYINGMAAVKIDGKWGFVDEKEELKIAADFFDAKDFNEKGSCFVKTGDKWQLLKLYRLNRED